MITVLLLLLLLFLFLLLGGHETIVIVPARGAARNKKGFAFPGRCFACPMKLSG
jgi:hypothetical protein